MQARAWHCASEGTEFEEVLKRPLTIHAVSPPGHERRNPYSSPARGRVVVASWHRDWPAVGRTGASGHIGTPRGTCLTVHLMRSLPRLTRTARDTQQPAHARPPG